jgi:hypothetical protein
MLGRALGAACAAAFVITGCGPDPDIVRASGELEAALAESERLGLPLTAAQLSGEAPPDSENAAAGLLEPLADWVKQRKAGAIPEEVDGPRPAAAKATDDPMLDFAAQLLARPDWHVDRDYILGLSLLMPELSELKQLSKAYVWRASDRAGAGDASGALEDLQSAQRLARLLSQEPSLIGGLVSIACDSIAGRAALSLAEFFQNEPMTLRRLAMLMRQTSFNVDLSTSLRGEAYYGIHISRNVHLYGGFNGLEAALADEEKAPPPRDSFTETNSPSDDKQRAYLARTLQFWNAVLSEEDSSLSSVSGRLEREAERLESASRPSDEALEYVMPVFDMSAAAYARQHVMQDMRRATVLAAAFRAEEGRWPKDLAEIGVEIKNPLSGEPVGYAAQGARITLWAPEPGTEDQGAVFEAKPGEKPDTWRIIWPDPKRG